MTDKELRRGRMLWTHAVGYWLAEMSVSWIEGPCWPTAWTWPC